MIPPCKLALLRPEGCHACAPGVVAQEGPADFTVAAAAGHAPPGRPPRGDRPRGHGPPRHDPPPKRLRESEAEVVNRIETCEGAGSPVKRRRSGNDFHGGDDGPRSRAHAGGAPAWRDGHGGRYDEPAREIAAAGPRGPPRHEGEQRREHPAEALRGPREDSRAREGGRDAPALPGPPPMPPTDGGGTVAPDAGPNFGLSGVLAADSKRNQRGTVQKYAPPDDACMPDSRWRIYIYKGTLLLSSWWCSWYCHAM